MKEERNDYNINNSDGVSAVSEEGRLSFANDDPSFVSESYHPDEAESFRASEYYTAQNAVPKADESEQAEEQIPASAISSVSSTTTTAVSSAASAATSSVGAFAGIVASSVATVAIVVAVFVSTLVINLSLVMADMYSLVFEVEMQGAQPEDFEDPIWAILTSADGKHFEQPVTADTVYLTFHDLEPNTEYSIVIKNSEKIFVEKTYFTASEPNEKGYLFAYCEEGDVFVIAEEILLGEGDYYTVIAKDEKGRVVYGKDGDEPFLEDSFTVDEAKSLYFTLSVGGKVCAVYELHLSEYEEQHVHAFGDPIPEVPADCETSGMAAHYVCETCGAYLDFDFNVVSASDLILSPLGHSYDLSSFAWTPIYGENPTNPNTSDAVEEPTSLPIVGYEAVACFVCQRDQSHVHYENATVSSVDCEATCEEDACVKYIAGVSFENSFYEDVHVDAEENTALGHLFEGEPEFVWTPLGGGGYSAVAVFTCSRDPSHKHEAEAEVSHDGIYYAEAYYNEQYYNSEYDPNVYLSYNENSGNIYITPTGYAQTESDTLPDELIDFVSFDEVPYNVTGQMMECGEYVLNFYQLDDNASESDVYLYFSELQIQPDVGCAPIRIVAKNTLNVYMTFDQTSVFTALDAPVFASLGDYAPTVNIYIYRYTEDNPWSFESEALFSAESGEIHLFMNDLDSWEEIVWVEYDASGEPLSS